MNKKRVLILLLICFTAVATLSADVGFGIKGSVGASSRTGDDWDSTLAYYGWSNELALSYGGGAYLNLGIIDFFSIQPEFLYSSYAFRFGVDDAWLQNRLNFFEVPVYAQLHFGSLVLQAGPNFTYATGTVKSLNSYGDTDTDAFSDLYDDPFAIGVAVGIAFFGEHTQFGVVYKRMMTEMITDVDVYLHTINVELGYTF
jgi:Outer membrane protein beta-barrel domain